MRPTMLHSIPIVRFSMACSSGVMTRYRISSSASRVNNQKRKFMLAPYGIARYKSSDPAQKTNDDAIPSSVCKTGQGKLGWLLGCHRRNLTFRRCALQSVRLMQNVRIMNETNASKVHLSRVKFQVTAENIKNACKADSRHCMIAQAIATELPHVRAISVDMMTIRWSDPAKGWRFVYLTPKPAQEALVRYDMGLEIRPFSFQVRSGHATPMNLGSGKNRKRAHKVRENKIAKVTDKTIVHSVGSESVPMWPAKKDSVTSVGSKPVPMGPGKKDSIDGIRRVSGPRNWHPSHNSLRQFGFRGFTEGFMPKPKDS
jgi:hypothetical protein